MRHAPWMLVLLLVVASSSAAGEKPPQSGATPTLLEPLTWLVMPPLERGGRAPFNASTLFARYLATPDATPPEAGALVHGRGTDAVEGAWTRIERGAKGSFGGGRHAAAFTVLEAPQAGVWIADIRNAAVLYVNGTPHAGDVYGHGIGRVPVHLVAGPNRLFAAGFRGAFRIAFQSPTTDLVFGGVDDTWPSAVRGERIRAAAAVTVLNATSERLPPRRVEASLDVGDDAPIWRIAGRIPPLPPLGSAKVPIDLGWRQIPADAEGVTFRTRTRGPEGHALEHARELGLQDASDAHRRTFRSSIDGSVQFYAARAPDGSAPPATSPGLVLTLHGASVDALNQARAYAPKPDFWIVAPTNRRPFGFDWQDWGRQDAYEVLHDALALSGVDRHHVHLTGHSMGGHGTWHLAVNDADGFASVAPSAGWMSFDTYGARPQGVLRDLWHRADAASLTHRWVKNLQGIPVHALHGTRDDNVPASEARQMQALLEPFHEPHTFTYVEGKGHWWDGEAAAGADCVDWPPFFEMFRTARVPRDVTSFDVTFPDLSLDAAHQWLRVEQAIEQGAPCRVRARWDADTNRLEIRPTNVRRFVVTLPEDAPAPSVTIGTTVYPDVAWSTSSGEARSAAFTWHGGRFRPAPTETPPMEKRPERMGPFKRVFDRHFVLVYGSAGTPEEQAATLAKARYDAEQWRVRANGLAVCLSDREYLDAGEALRGRNVILYGNAQTNAAWCTLVPDDCPIRVHRGRVEAGSRTFEGKALGVLLVYPKRDDPNALVGLVGDTGPAGTRLCFRVPYFVSGVGLPDFVVFGPEVLERGDEGVRTAGFFDTRWQLAE